MKAAIATLALVLVGTAPSTSPAAPAGASGDREAAHFAPCRGALRVTCVVDGDTLWYRGAKIRLADINAPELSAPRCHAEARLGAHAARRLADLLNAGGFTLRPADRVEDAYGRRLLVATRDGESLGAMLTAEGLAEPWRGHRRAWCRS